MQREFFSLENILLGGLFLILLIYSGFMISCTPPGGHDLSLFSLDRDDDDDVAIADRGNSRDRRPCDDRDSCQDSCDYMFRNSSSRSNCYELNFDEVSDLERVFDELHSSSISVRSLEDVNVGSFRDFLEMDADSWVDIILGEEGTDHAGHQPYSSGDAHNALKWIAENENVARAIIRADEHYDVLYHLFLRRGDDITASSATFTPPSPNNTSIKWDATTTRPGLKLNSGSPVFALTTDDLKFVLGFIGSDDGRNLDLGFSSMSFMSYADDEDNEAAVELAHGSLVRFCEDVTDDELPDEDVQQCILATYCSIYDVEGNDNIFEDALSDHDASAEHCASGILVNNNNDRLERLFDD